MSKHTEPFSGEVIVYQAPDGEVRVDVRLERETVWLSQKQIAELLDTSADNVGLHLKNIYAEGELQEAATTEDSSVVQTEGRRQVRRQLRHYNLDAILSVGYRVNSKRGTQFRIWATRTLREHLLRGYTLNERRLRERGLGEIEQAVALLARTLTTHALVTDEGRAVLEVVQRYTRAWRLLLEYDENRLPGTPARPIAPVSGARPWPGRNPRGHRADVRWPAALPQRPGPRGAPALLRDQDHPFGDGNKRIGTLLFLEYLLRNGLMTRADGNPHLADNAVVALALLIAESAPSQKELMIRLVLNLLEDNVPRAQAE